jgi:uncharacterized protein YdaU (DUF1376 family)
MNIGKKTPWTRMFWSDYAADTAHLDFILEGAYIKLLKHIYQHCRALPGDLNKIYSICHAHTPTEQNAIREILAEFFFEFMDPEYGLVYRHSRAEQEIENANVFHDKRSVGGLKTAVARWDNEEAKAKLEEMGIDFSSASSSATSTASSSACSNHNHNHNYNNNQEKDKNTYGENADPETPEAPTKPSGRKRRVRVSKEFVPPTLEEIKACIKEKGYRYVDAEDFLDYNTENEWRKGDGTKILRWRAALSTWEQNRKRREQEKPQSQPQTPTWASGTIIGSGVKNGNR